MYCVKGYNSKKTRDNEMQFKKAVEEYKEDQEGIWKLVFGVWEERKLRGKVMGERRRDMSCAYDMI